MYSEKWVEFMRLTKDLEGYTLSKSFHFLSLSSFHHYKVLGPIYSTPDPIILLPSPRSSPFTFSSFSSIP